MDWTEFIKWAKKLTKEQKQGIEEVSRLPGVWKIKWLSAEELAKMYPPQKKEKNNA